MIRNVFSIINKIERKLGINFGIDYIEYTDSRLFKESACFIADENGCTIKIGSNLTGNKLRIIVYHELGHALLWRYRIPKKMLRIFRNDSESLGIKDTDFLYHFVTNDIFLRLFLTEKPQFVSLYSQINWEEDFCELFAEILFGKSFSSKNEVLQMKIKSVNAVIQYILDSHH